MKRLMIILLLAGLMAALSCSDIGFEYDNPLDSKGTNYGFTLTTSAEPTYGGSVTKTGGVLVSGGKRYKPYTDVTVKATALSGYKFQRWTGASSSTDTSIKIQMNDNITLTANFTLDKDEPEPPCPPTQPECPGYVPPTQTACAANFKTIKIGTKTWMAENLNCNVGNSKCYDNDPANCAKYGRLYNWTDAMSACPVGWHLPSDAEWTQLTDFVGSDAGTKLKSPNYWESYSGVPKGTDDYGFAALPGGNGFSDGSFYNAGNNGNWWSATEGTADYAYRRYMYYNLESVNRNGNLKTYLFSVRCVAD